MPGRTTIQWDGAAIEDLGLLEVDLLRPGARTQAHACFDLLREHEGIDHFMARAPPNDARTYAMSSRAGTVGVARAALVMGVTGRVQSEGRVVHWIGGHPWEPELGFESAGTSTRSLRRRPSSQFESSECHGEDLRAPEAAVDDDAGDCHAPGPRRIRRG